MPSMAVLSLSRNDFASGFPLVWKLRMPPIGTERCTVLRAVLRVIAWRFRQRSRTQGATASTGGGLSHSHTNPNTGAATHTHEYVKGAAATYVPDDSTFDGVSLVASATLGPGGGHTHTQPDTGAHTLTVDQIPGHTHGNPDNNPAMSEDTLPIVDILIDGTSYKTGLTPTTDGEVIVDEDVAEKIKTPGDHTIEFRTTQNGAVEASLEVEW